MDRTTTTANGNGRNAPESIRRFRGRTGIDGTHPTHPMAYGNGPNEPERTRSLLGSKGIDRMHPTIRTGMYQTHRERTVKDRTHMNQPYDHRGAQEWIQRTPTKPKTPMAGTERTHSTTPRSNTNTITPRAHGNGPNAHERTRRPPWRMGMDRTQTNETQGARELNERTPTIQTTTRAHEN